MPARSGRSAPSLLQIYVGNYEYDASEREIEKMLNKYGRVERVEFKSGATSHHHAATEGAGAAPASSAPAPGNPAACLPD